MKRTRIFALGIFLLIALVITGCSKNSASDVVTVASDATYPSFEFVDDRIKEKVQV